MTPSRSTQDALTLVGRALLACLFIPAGFSKIAGFAGVSGYIASKSPHRLAQFREEPINFLAGLYI